MNAVSPGRETPVVREGVLYCRNCRREFHLDPLLFCPHCTGVLEYLLASDTETQARLKQRLMDKNRAGSRSGHFRFVEFLPLAQPAAIVSLGEGNTPLLHCESMNQTYSLRRLYLKDEGRNPTGSWKDRPISLVVNCAKNFGYRAVSLYSCGNAGSSSAAYAAKAGLKNIIFVLPTIDGRMYDLMVSYGGRIVPVQISPHDLWSSSKVGELLEEAQVRSGWFPVTTVRNPYVGSPYYTEGFKTIAYEIFQDLGEVVPDWVLVPVGSGEGLCGVWRGFKNVQWLGVTTKVPKIVGVQAETAAPLVEAYRQRKDRVEFVEGAKTVAAGLEVMISSNCALEAIKESHGCAESVSDSAIVQAMIEIRQSEGVNASPEGATTWAAAKKMKAEGRLKEDDLIVCISSASGFKYAEPKPDTAFPKKSLPLDLTEISDYVNDLSA